MKIKSFIIALLLLPAVLSVNVVMANNMKQKSLISKLPKKGKIVKETNIEALGVKDLELSNGVRVLFKSTDSNEDEVMISATQRGGSSLYGEKDWANCEKFNTFFSQWNWAGRNNEWIQNNSGNKIEVFQSMDTYEDQVRGNSSVKDLETLFQLIYLQFTDVSMDENNYNTLIKAMEKELQEDEQATDDLFFQENVFMDSIMSVLYDHNWRYKIFKSTDIARLNYDRIVEIAKERTANAAGYTFVIVGPVDESTIRPYIERYIASLPANKDVKSNWVNVTTHPQRDVICHFTHKMKQPRASINIRWINTQIPYSDENEIKARLLSDYLKFKRHRQRICADNGNAYHPVGGNHQHYMEGDRPFTEVHTFVTVKPELADEVTRILKEEMEKACEHIDEAGLEEFKQEMIQSRERYKSRAGDWRWMSIINNYASTGEVDIDQDDVPFIKSLTPEDISAFARELLATGHMLEIVMTPE
ncbi:MAG: insulinase family protein [Muribaculaceae bacterium]|nr:insulinase family protein [Muribaculaceae bacterium]